MERDLFEWDAWDFIDDGMLQFYGCTLKKPIGRFNIGEKVPIILLDFEHGILQLFRAGQAGMRGAGALISEHKVRAIIND